MAFDFSQPRWQADCRELSNDEKNAFLLALEKAFPKLRWASGCKPSEINFNCEESLCRGKMLEWGLTCGRFDVSFQSLKIATASDVREFTAATLVTTITDDDASVRSYNVGKSDYAKHKIQPWDIWLEYGLNPWDADIVKRVLRYKDGESRVLDYEKIIHVCRERIRQIKAQQDIAK